MCEPLFPLGCMRDQQVRWESRIEDLASALDAHNGQRVGVKETDLDKHTRLVPVDALIGDLAIAEADNDDKRHLDPLASRGNARKHPVHLDGMGERVNHLVYQLVMANGALIVCFFLNSSPLR